MLLSPMIIDADDHVQDERKDKQAEEKKS